MAYVLLIAFLLLLLFIVVAVKKRQAKETSAPPYILADALFTPAERSFYGVLVQAAGSDAVVFGKVRVADVLRTKTGLDASSRKTAFNRISAKHFDFVLCRPSNLNVLGAVELNDSSHNHAARQERDVFLEDACKEAGLPLIAIKAKAAYSPTELRETLKSILDTSPTDKVSVKVDQGETVAANGNEVPLCPKCSSLMVKRVAKGGTNAGKEFWGCSRFPDCRGVVT